MKKNKLIIIIFISIVIVLGIIIGIIILQDSNECKWCDDNNIECHINEDGKTECSVIDKN
jgi:uncharacterized alpha/beta hydrolase family protein